jgi:hypothetical protein
MIAVAAALAVSACGGGGASPNTDTIPYPNGPWSSGDQGTFIGSCTADDPSSGTLYSYCKCALGSVMNMDPDPKSIGASLLDAGMTAASHPEDFSGCPKK